MEKRRNVRICMLALCLAMTVLFTGCALVQTMQNQVMESALETVVDTTVDAVASQNEDISRVADHLQAKVDLQVLDSSITGDSITATCVISAPDMREFIGSFNLKDYENEKALCDAVIAAIDEAPVTQTEITVGMKKTENGYEPLELDAFLDAYLCGGFDILEDLRDQSK